MLNKRAFEDYSVKASVVFGAMTKYDNMHQEKNGEQYKREQCNESEWKGNFLEKFPEIPTAFHSTKNSRLPFDGTIRAMKSPKKPKMHVNCVALHGRVSTDSQSGPTINKG